MFLTLWVPAAAAQQSGASSGSSAGAGNPVPRREAVPVPVRPAFPQPQPGAPQQLPAQPLVFLSGTVVREDGTPPPYGAVIETNCAGSITKEAVVGVNGRFNFQYGGENRFAQVFADASQGGESFPSDSGTGSGYPSSSMRQRTKRLLGCEIRAQLAGFRSTSISVTEEPQHGSNELGMIVVYPIDRVQGNMVSVTDLMAPKGARKFLEKGRKAAQKEKLAEAQGYFQSAVKEYPKYAEAWYYIGLIHEHEKRPEQAASAYREAINADGFYLKPYLRLAQSASANRQWREAADLTDKVISLDPVTRVEAYLICALAHLNLNELDISEKRARQGQKMDFSGQYPQFYLVLASVQSVRHDMEGSARELRSYLKVASNAPNANLIRLQLKKIEDEEKSTVANSNPRSTQP